MKQQRLTRQPVPKVTEEDVKRVALRDFGIAQLPEVFSILNGLQDLKEDPRIRLAVMKLANQDIKRLPDRIKSALRDWRDTLVAAEYPTSDYDADWLQYRQWLTKK